MSFTDLVSLKMEDRLKVFPGQIQFGLNKIADGRVMLQFRQVAPALVQLATGTQWRWSEWQDILEVSHGDENERKDAERDAAQGNAA